VVECILILANRFAARGWNIVFVLEDGLVGVCRCVLRVLTSGVGKSSDGLGRLVILSLHNLS
jgi:hypothetical protein